MSVVTTILLLPDAREPQASIHALNEQLVQLRPGPGDRFRNLSEVHPYPEPSPSDHWGGSKAPEADVWAAALNHISGDEVARAARRCDWAYPALLVYQDDGDDRWSHVMLGLSLKPELGEG